MILKDQNTRDHSAWTIGNGDLMHEVCIHTGYLAHGNSKDETRGKSRYKNYSNKLID